MTIAHIALVIALVAWLIQFVAWRREIITRQQLELRLEKLQAYYSMTAHPALRYRPALDWVRKHFGDTNE